MFEMQNIITILSYMNIPAVTADIPVVESSCQPPCLLLKTENEDDGAEDSDTETPPVWWHILHWLVAQDCNVLVADAGCSPP